MAPKKKDPVVKTESKPEAEEPPSLRRSTRSTRGSVKPVVDLTQEQEVDEDDVGQQEVVNKREPGRRSSTTRRESVKKEPVKKEPARRASTKKPARRASTKKPAAKQEQQDEVAEPPMKEEEEEESGKSPEQLDAAVDDEEVDLSYDLSEKEMKEINHAFDMNKLSDTDELLNTDGLRTAIRSLGFEPRGDEIKRLMNKFAKGNKVNRDGFHRMIAFKFSTTAAMRSSRDGANDEISRVFDLLDLDKTGLITLDNLRSIAKELNEDLDDDDLREMIMEADKDHDFRINKLEFEDIMRKTSLY